MGYAKSCPRPELALSYGMNRITTRCLADTGAAVSIISSNLLTRLGIDRSRLTKDGMKLNTATAGKMVVLGTVRLDTSCLCTKPGCKRTKSIKYQVAQGLVEDVIIGVQECQKLGLITIHHSGQTET